LLPPDFESLAQQTTYREKTHKFQEHRPNLRVTTPHMESGHCYHIYNRGNNRERIFYEDCNYIFFLKCFDQYLSAYVEVLAYCLMPTHFHFFIRIREQQSSPADDTAASNFTITKAFKNFFISYSKSINKAYNRNGSLFQANFKKKKIEDDSYYSATTLYIHLNPVVAGLCERCKEWKYSSYNAFVSNKPTKIQTREILNWFGGLKAFVSVHDEKTSKVTQKGADFRSLHSRGT